MEEKLDPAQPGAGGRNELDELGEFGLIDRISNNFTDSQPSTVLGIGDDAAIISPEDEMVISTDILTEGIHFDLSYFPLKHLSI